MLSFFKLIRWKNLLMIALVQLLIKYGLLEPFGVEVSLSELGIALLILATICIAAAGYIINDINDIKTDFINKPNSIIIGKEISEKTAYTFFIALNVVGVGIGFYLSNTVNRAPFFSLFVIISVLLYIYATYLKSTPLIGNIVISILVALSIIIVGIFELLPATNPINQKIQFTFFRVIFDYALFAFSINLLREITKDIEDIEGDTEANLNTLPIAIGKNRTITMLAILNFIPLIGTVFYVISTLYKQPIVVGYFLIFIVAPLLYITIKTFSSETKKDYNLLSKMYKLVMLFGMFSLLLYKYVILN